jgi:two-component system sensor histidine kinase KdpD
VTVRETVPDKILERADQIVVVDLPPEELIKRLKEGKVYLPDNARRAVDRFFKPGNLTALRELALRRTADRVDEQMIAHLRQHAIEGAWPTTERLLVCVGNDQRAEALVRAAARLATSMKCAWTAVHLYSVDLETLDRATRRRSEKALRLAERLGAETIRLSGKDLVAELIRFARRNNVTQIVLGRSRAGWLRRARGLSLTDQVIAAAKGLSVTVVAQEEVEASKWSWPTIDVGELGRALLSGLGATTLAVMAGRSLAYLTPLPNVAVLFLLAVLVCAVQFGVLAAVVASFFSFLAYNFFFIEPTLTFTVAEPYEVVSLLIFLVVSLISGGLAGRVRDQSRSIQERAESMRSLYEFSRKLSAAPSIDDVLWIFVNAASQSVKGTAVVLLPDGPDLKLRAAWPPEDTISTADLAAARWAVREQQQAGRYTGTMPTARFHWRPLISAGGGLGAIGIEQTDVGEPLPPPTDTALQALIDQTAIAIERTHLVEKSTRAEAEVETERLRAAMLSSISHDLRTPLSSILGSVTSLRALGDKMPEKDRSDLLATIEDEAGRLSRFVTNMLDITRIEAGRIDIKRDWVDVGDVVRSAVSRGQKLFPRRRCRVEVGPGLPLVRGDAALLEQVLFNLLDNADKYGGPASVTAVRAARRGGDIGIVVEDQGPGIPEAELPRVFDKFFRGGQSDGRPPGTGLGLSIAHGLVSGMGGSVRAESPVADGRGTRVVLTLPVPEQPSGEIAR